MGFNTTVVVLNDALNTIERDQDFGRKLSAALSERSLPVRVIATDGRISCDAARIIETHHADYDVLVSVGGNTGKVVLDIRPGLLDLVVKLERGDIKSPATVAKKLRTLMETTVS